MNKYLIYVLVKNLKRSQNGHFACHGIIWLIVILVSMYWIFRYVFFEIIVVRVCMLTCIHFYISFSFARIINSSHKDDFLIVVEIISIGSLRKMNDLFVSNTHVQIHQYKTVSYIDYHCCISRKLCGIAGFKNLFALILGKVKKSLRWRMIEYVFSCNRI